MRRRIVKSCFSLAAILLWGIFGTFTSVHSAAAQSASAWPLVNCATNTPCVNNEPVNTHTGDSLPVAMSKLNADIKQLAVMFGSLSNLALNGSAKASDIIGLWTNCSSIDPVLGYQGTCISGGSGSFTVDTAPSGISVTPPCTYNMVKVTATDYQIAAPVQSAPTTSSTGGSLTGSTYYYVVTATTSAGQTTASSQQSIASDTLAPPTIGTATDSTTGGTGLSPSTTYYYVVTALNANGQTLASGEVSATTSTGSTDSITVTWTAVSGATGYNVYRGTASTAENVYYAAGNVTSFTDTGATSTSGSPPGVNTAYLTNTNENVISWTAVTGATGYVVYRSTTSGNFTNATSYTVSGGSTATFTDTGATGTTATPPTSNTSGQFTINAPSTCTPTDGQKLELKIISPSGGIVTYAFNSAYLASGSLALPTTSYAAGKEDYFQTQYDADKSDWVVLSYNQGF
jgi:hypothetical protein